MKLSFARVALLPAALLAVVMTGASQEPKSAGKAPNLNNLSMENAALQALHDLELSPAQLRGLAKLAKEAAPKGERRQAAKASAELTKAMVDLHAAYSRGDDNKIGEASEQLDQLMEKEEPELDVAITLTEAAKDKAAEALKLLNVRQAGTFLGTLEHTDPAELLTTAMEQVRGLKGKELEEEIASVAEEVAWLVDGLDGAETEKIEGKVTALLKRTAAFKSAADFGRQRKALDEEVREIVGEVENTDVLSHILEHGMAELLSNPRLVAAISIQQRVPASRPATKPKTSTGKTPK